MGKVAADMVEVVEGISPVGGWPSLEVRLAGVLIDHYPRAAGWAGRVADSLRRALAKIPEAEMEVGE